jgi:hypothetical protein
MLGSMSSEFDDWITSLGLGQPDEGGDVGVPPVGRHDFFQEMFDAHGGPVPHAELRTAWAEREMSLIVHAVELVKVDLSQTTDLSPVIVTLTLPDGVIAVTYNGSYETPVVFAIRDPEATCEVADYLRNQIVEDLWTVWPTCPSDGLRLDPIAVDGRAVWQCVGRHIVAEIGRLGDS